MKCGRRSGCALRRRRNIERMSRMASRVTKHGESGDARSFSRQAKAQVTVGAEGLRALVQRFALLAGVGSKYTRRHFAMAPRETDPAQRSPSSFSQRRSRSELNYRTNEPETTKGARSMLRKPCSLVSPITMESSDIQTTPRTAILPRRTPLPRNCGPPSCSPLQKTPQAS